MNHSPSDSARHTPKLLVVPSEELTLAPSLVQSKKRWGSGMVSFAIASAILCLCGVAFALAHISTLEPDASPILVHSSPPLRKENTEESATPVSASSRVVSLPPSPLQNRVQPHAILSVSAPESSFSFPSVEELGMDASEKIALLEKLNAQEEERMNQLLLAEKAAEEEKKKLVELALQKRLEDERREKELLAQQEEAARRQREVAALRQSQVREQAERDRATSLARQVSRAPTVSKRSQPRYPSSARKAGFEGTTRISATVTSSGKVEAPHVVVSSGHSSLDSSALAAVKKWHFNPAQNSVGDSIAYQLTIPVTFRLN